MTAEEDKKLRSRLFSLISAARRVSLSTVVKEQGRFSTYDLFFLAEGEVRSLRALWEMQQRNIKELRKRCESGKQGYFAFPTRRTRDED